MTTTARYAAKQNEAEARERLRAFWAGSSLGRPALNITIPTGQGREPELPADCGGSLKAADLRPDWHAARAANWLRAHRFLAESMPGVHVVWGSLLTTLPVLAGGDYEYDGSAWIRPMPDVYDRPRPVFDPAHPTVRTLEACYAAAAAPLRGQAFVSPPLKWLDAFREIRRRGLCLYIGCGVDEAVAVTREIGSDGLCFTLWGLATEPEAESAIARIQAAVR